MTKTWIVAIQPVTGRTDVETVEVVADHHDHGADGSITFYVLAQEVAHFPAGKYLYYFDKAGVKTEAKTEKSGSRPAPFSGIVKKMLADLGVDREQADRVWETAASLLGSQGRNP